MAIDRLRRDLIIGAGAAAVGAVTWFRLHSGRELYLAACDDASGRHYLAAAGSEGAWRYRIPVPERAHAVTVLPGTRRAVYFARRPGTVSYVVDIDTGELVATLRSPPGRHFYGHGASGADGLLYTSENDYANARGVIGVWDTCGNVSRVAEFASGGTGPHELAFLSDGKTLAVANGGIETHPERGREKLNIHDMQPSLTYIDTVNRQVLDSFRPADHRMSLRHLAVTANDQVVIGVQYEGDKDRLVPLLLAHRGEGQLQEGAAGPALWRSHRNYIASVAASRNGRQALLTAPRGATLSLWDLATLSPLGQHPLRDVAGAAASEQGGFVVSSGTGMLRRVGAAEKAAGIATGERMLWDNHLAVI